MLWEQQPVVAALSYSDDLVRKGEKKTLVLQVQRELKANAINKSQQL